ncbi:hypothetical protein DPX39_050021800 [Trypanosoma brucei equiperdum]|uniref:CFA20 domain-containing protein n=1 Tax=Trypanosoma brucei equiperdum TaxID=630700 RepID=A0A3L6L8Q9_9TRYP|nr:hypothetical protein DPX39_050021800 [Trypanosoma brucei equiperdum]
MSEPLMARCASLLDILVPRSVECLSNAKVQNESCCAIQYDRILRVPVLIMKGDISNARVQIPHDGKSLPVVPLPCTLVALQAYIGSFDTFALEVSVSTKTSLRVKLIIGTHFNKTSLEDTGSSLILFRMPLIIPRNRWVQIVFHISGIVTHLLELPPIKFIDAISLSGTCKASRLMASNSEEVVVNATPSDMTLFAVPAYAPPIWQTVAASPPPNGTCSDNNKKISGRSPQKVAKDRLPVVVKSPLRRDDDTANEGENDSPKHNVVRTAATSASNGTPSPPYKQIGREVSAIESTSSANSFDVPPEGRAPSLPGDFTDARRVKQMPKQQVGQPAARCGSAAYIRLVSGANFPPRSSSNPTVKPRPLHLGAKEQSPSAVTTPPPPPVETYPGVCDLLFDASYGITGWGETACRASTAASASPPRAGSDVKCRSAPTAAVPTNRISGGAVSDCKTNGLAEQVSPKAKRLKRVIEIRRRSFVPPTRRRKPCGGDGQNGEGNETGAAAGGTSRRSAVSMRRLYMRKRIRKLKEAQNSARRMQEMKRLPASELPIDPQDEALMMVGEETMNVTREPRCGYGFGYLGVLHESGGFEADENADTELKGALTLELSELSDGEENEE